MTQRRIQLQPRANEAWNSLSEAARAYLLRRLNGVARCFTVEGREPGLSSHLHHDGYCLSYQLGESQSLEVTDITVFCALRGLEPDGAALNREPAWTALRAQVVDELADATDLLVALREAARRTVPSLADCVRLDLVDRHGALRCQELVHQDPVKQQELMNICSAVLWPPIARVLSTGQPFLISKMDDAVRAELLGESVRQLPAWYAPRSALICPLRSRGQVLGALTLVMVTERAPFQMADVTSAQLLCRALGPSADIVRLLDLGKGA